MTLVVTLWVQTVSHGAPSAAKLVAALGWDIGKQGGFPTCLIADPSGNVWVGTEGNGLWEYDPMAKKWRQFTTKDGLGDECVYALAVDGQKRIWAGHLNHGVSVYNGNKWKDYDIVDGPLGDRVFSIAVSPKDGDVWIATDMGLARYSEKRADWDYYTRASGLPSDQIESIVFGSDGRLYAGTQCDGVAMSGPDDDFKKWTTIRATAPVPSDPTGKGLPTDLINRLVYVPGPVAPHENIAILSPKGLAIIDENNQVTFIRGQDWAGSNPGPAVAGQAVSNPLPAEDWVTALAPDGKYVWAGYRRSGLEHAGEDGTADKIEANVTKPASVIIRDILAQPGEPPLIAAYDGTSGGLLTIESAPAYTAPNGVAAPGSTYPALPVPAPTPVVDESKALATQLAKFSQDIARGEAFYVADDWRTEGDWVGRYGSSYALLCGMAGNGDQTYKLEPGYEVSITTGPHHAGGGDTAGYYHDNEWSDDLRSLYDPTLGYRRDAEDNDGSYEPAIYPETYDGPDLWVRLKVPEGVHCLSLYFLNNDAHGPGGNKYRDYDVTIVPDNLEEGKVAGAPALARTRVTDFWGGVYKQFLIAGPARYVARIGRNRSFCTKLQGVFLDHIGSQPEDRGKLPGFDTAPYAPPMPPAGYSPPPLVSAAADLWSELDDSLPVRGAVPLQMPFRLWAYRAAIAGGAPAALLENFRWDISIWTPDDRKNFDAAMKAAHDALKPK